MKGENMNLRFDIRYLDKNNRDIEKIFNNHKSINNSPFFPKIFCEFSSIGKWGFNLLILT